MKALAASDPNSNEEQGNAGSAHRRVGMLALRRGRWEEAQRWLGLARQHCLRTQRDGPESCALEDQWLGYVAAKLGRRGEAMRLLGLALGKAERLALRQPRDRRLVVGQATLHRGLGDLRLLDDDTRAQDDYKSALRLLDELLATAPEHPSLLLDRARCLVRLGDVHLLSADLDEAERYYDQALPVQRRLTATTDSRADRKVERVETNLRLAFIYQRRGDEARAARERAEARSVIDALRRAGLLNQDTSLTRAEALLARLGRAHAPDAAALVGM